MREYIGRQHPLTVVCGCIVQKLIRGQRLLFSVPDGSRRQALVEGYAKARSLSPRISAGAVYQFQQILLIGVQIRHHTTLRHTHKRPQPRSTSPWGRHVASVELRRSAHVLLQGVADRPLRDQNPTTHALSAAVLPASTSIYASPIASIPDWRLIFSQSRLFTVASCQNSAALRSNSPGPQSFDRF